MRNQIRASVFISSLLEEDTLLGSNAKGYGYPDCMYQRLATRTVSPGGWQARQSGIYCQTQFLAYANRRNYQTSMESRKYCEADTVTLGHLPEAVSKAALSETTTPLRARLDQIEREHITQILASSRTFEAAAITLGIDVSTPWRERKRYQLSRVKGSKA